MFCDDIERMTFPCYCMIGGNPTRAVANVATDMAGKAAVDVTQVSATKATSQAAQAIAQRGAQDGIGVLDAAAKKGKMTFGELLDRADSNTAALKPNDRMGAIDVLNKIESKDEFLATLEKMSGSGVGRLDSDVLGRVQFAASRMPNAQAWGLGSKRAIQDAVFDFTKRRQGVRSAAELSRAARISEQATQALSKAKASKRLTVQDIIDMDMSVFRQKMAPIARRLSEIRRTLTILDIEDALRRGANFTMFPMIERLTMPEEEVDVTPESVMADIDEILDALENGRISQEQLRKIIQDMEDGSDFESDPVYQALIKELKDYNDTVQEIIVEDEVESSSWYENTTGMVVIAIIFILILIGIYFMTQ